MKKLFVFILAVVMLFSFTACSEKVKESETVDIEEVQDIFEDEIQKNVEIEAGVFWYDFSDAFLSNVRDALNYKLDELGVEYENYDAAKTQATQNEQIDEAITNGANLLIVNIVDIAAVDAAQAITDRAKNANIPVIFFNREVSSDVINSYENACFVGTNYLDIHEKMGLMVGQYVADNYTSLDLNNDGKISYIFLNGYLANEEGDPRQTTFLKNCRDTLTAAEKDMISYYDLDNSDMYQFGNWGKQDGYEIMSVALTTNPMDGALPIEMVIAHNDNMALGCIEVLNTIGWNTGSNNENIIPVFGVDYTEEAAAAIEAGKMTGSIMYSYEGMAETIAALVGNVMNGEHVFAGAYEVFNVDEEAAKIRVPYEIKM